MVLAFVVVSLAPALQTTSEESEFLPDHYESIKATDLQTIVGPVKWDGSNVPPFATANVTKTPLVGGQWRLKDDGGYDLIITDNKTAPDIPTGGTMETIS